MVMQAMLGSWDKSAPGAAHAASPLAQSLASNNLANSFMAFNTNYADTGLFGVHVSSDAKEALDDAAFCVMQELRGLIYDPKLEDVVRREAGARASLLLHSESSTSAAAEEIGRQLLTYGRRIPRAELFARIDRGHPGKLGRRRRGSTFATDVRRLPPIRPTQFLPDYNRSAESTTATFTRRGAGGDDEGANPERRASFEIVRILKRTIEWRLTLMRAGSGFSGRRRKRFLGRVTVARAATSTDSEI